MKRLTDKQVWKRAQQCPFCGFIVELSIWESESGYWHVICSCCATRGPEGETQIKAIKEWNTRYGVPEPK